MILGSKSIVFRERPAARPLPTAFGFFCIRAPARIIWARHGTHQRGYDDSLPCSSHLITLHQQQLFSRTNTPRMPPSSRLSFQKQRWSSRDKTLARPAIKLLHCEPQIAERLAYCKVSTIRIHCAPSSVAGRHALGPAGAVCSHTLEWAPSRTWMRSSAAWRIARYCSLGTASRRNSSSR